MRSGDLEVTQLGVYPSKFYTISIMRVKKADEEKEEEKGDDEEKEKIEENPNDDGRIIYHLW